MELEGGVVEDGAYIPEAPVVRHLEGDGDFRSSECLNLLKQADIVVTNPPFSLFRKYVAQLIKYDKKFVIIGSKSAITSKKIFPLIKNNQMWTGYGFRNGNAFFKVNDVGHYENKSYYDKSTGLVKFRNVGWFTNLEHTKRYEKFYPTEDYKSKEYPKYDNFDAIEVSEVKRIPKSYKGMMGVPVSFIDKYNPDQFEILGADVDFLTHLSGGQASRFYVNSQRKYARLVIRFRRI